MMACIQFGYWNSWLSFKMETKAFPHSYIEYVICVSYRYSSPTLFRWKVEITSNSVVCPYSYCVSHLYEIILRSNLAWNVVRLLFRHYSHYVLFRADFLSKLQHLHIEICVFFSLFLSKHSINLVCDKTTCLIK